MNTCTFIGHRDCLPNIIPLLRQTIETLITENHVKTFYVGTNGNFDRLVYNILIELRCIYDIKINVVLAYLNKNDTAYYDENLTIFPSVLEMTPPKYAILKRNEYMLDNSGFLICYINNSFTNSYSIAKKALRMNIKVINLGEFSLS